MRRSDVKLLYGLIVAFKDALQPGPVVPPRYPTVNFWISGLRRVRSS